MRKHFYTEDGKIKKYTYCIRGCPEPYRQDEIGIKILQANNTTFVCEKCIKVLGITNSLIQEETSNRIKKITEIIDEEIGTQEEIVEEVVKEEKEEIVKEELKVQLEEDSKSDERNIAFVLRCKDGTYYCGLTSNVETAIKYHNSGSGSNQTKPQSRRPVSLVKYKKASSIEEAKKIRDEFKKFYK